MVAESVITKRPDTAVVDYGLPIVVRESFRQMDTYPVQVMVIAPSNVMMDITHQVIAAYRLLITVQIMVYPDVQARLVA